MTRAEKKRLARINPSKWAQIQARKAEKVKRQVEVKAIRDAAWGHPVHGIPTPFVESFDSGGQASLSTPRTDRDGNPLERPRELPTSPDVLNYLLSGAELDDATATSYELAKPLVPANRNVVDSVGEDEDLKLHEERHRKAVMALERITTLGNASSRDKTHANIRRCIETFGRHATDLALRPRPSAPNAAGHEIVPRAGPDTGSSEVQIAILTVKIRALARQFEGPKGNKDKANKRNLRSLLHRRQKLMKYMERKERGGERWTHLVQTLGLTPATYKEQISI